MAQVTLSGSNSKVVVGIASNQGFVNRVRSLVFEHALNLIDAGGATANQTAWANAVLGGRAVNSDAIAAALAVNADPSAVTLSDTATDAQLRNNFDAVIDRCIDGWVAENP